MFHQGPLSESKERSLGKSVKMHIPGFVELSTVVIPQKNKVVLIFYIIFLVLTTRPSERHAV